MPILLLLLFAQITQILVAQNFEKPLTFGLFAKTQYYKYDEPNVMDIQGVMPGIAAFARLNLENSRHSISAEYFANGATRYNGSECLVGQTTCWPIKAKSSDEYYDLRYTASLLSYFSRRVVSFWEIGLGYRYLENLGEGSGFYKRQQDYLYLHSGYSVEFRARDFELLGRVGVMSLLRGNNTSGFKALGFANDLKFRQKSGFGLRLEGGVGAEMDFGARILAGLYFEYWSIAKSSYDWLYDANGAQISKFVEPANNTKTFGIYGGVEF